MTAISVVIPTYNRPRELRACLEGFANQSAPRDAFEVVLIDDGSPEPVEVLAGEFAERLNVVCRRIENSGPSAARNLGIEQAGSELLVLYDDDLAPRTGLIDYCLNFHASRPAEEDAALLWFRAEPAIREECLLQWAFPRMYPFPESSAVCDWRKFWSGTVTCKKSLFRSARFDEKFRALEDAEFALRLSRRIDLRVHFERRLMGLHTRPVELAQLVSRNYAFGYYNHRLAAKYPGAWGMPTAIDPEALVLPDSEQDSILNTIEGMLKTQPAQGSPLYPVLAAMLTKLERHAFARGWIAARAGGPPAPQTVFSSGRKDGGNDGE